jgi:glycine/D-amino acid oxidase-like deaminating enzyme
MREYDVLIVGGGVAGLWVGNTLLRAGYDVIVIEKDRLGAGQTLASQGMIHGGQKYLLEGFVTSQASAAAKMPARWQACFQGRGEIDLRAVQVLSETQVMWPAGSLLSAAAMPAAARLVNAASTRLRNGDVPGALKHGEKFSRPAYLLPEKVLDVRSLLLAMVENLRGRVVQGEVGGVSPEGQVTVAGETLRAQAIVFTAGAGNERALDLLRVQGKTQRRPLRQIMVRPLSQPLFGHGIVASARPRITVTSHTDGTGRYIWYLGGNVAEEGAGMDAADAVRFAKRELAQIFPGLDWSQKQWATWYGDRAEPLDAKGELPGGPWVHQHGRVLLAWPSKLTFAPALSDLVRARLENIKPGSNSAPPPLPPATVGLYPWEAAAWQSIA